MHRIIHLHVDAPAKPAEGAPCNGCGVCCALEPCPVGQLLSRRRSGACVALAWSDEAGRYLCGMVARPASLLPTGLRWAAPMAARLARRFIASGIGCDARLEVEVEAGEPPAPH